MIKKIANKIIKKAGKSIVGRKPRGRPRKKTDQPRSVSAVLLRPEGNPIILPKKENSWESWQTFNPGVVLLDGKVHFLYRAIGEDGISRFGYAVSKDGFKIDERSPRPVYEHEIKERSFNIFSYFSGGSWGGAEDARIVRVDEEDVLYMTYTACKGGLRVGLTSIGAADFLDKKWNWKPPVLISPPGELHKNWLIFPEKINGKYALLHGIVPKVEVAYCDRLDFDGTNFIRSPRGFGPMKNGGDKGCWDKWIRGAGAPPIKTREGWLLFYHAMDNDWSKYKAGAMLLSLDDPSKVLYRSSEPILSPTESYENNGHKPGIVYISGAIVKDGRLLIYYGCADNYVCVAYADLDEFLEAIKRKKKPLLQRKMLKKINLK